MPLPKPPGKPATLLDISSAVEARATRPAAARPPKPAPAAAHEVVPMSAVRGAAAQPAQVPAMAPVTPVAPSAPVAEPPAAPRSALGMARRPITAPSSMAPGGGGNN